MDTIVNLGDCPWQNRVRPKYDPIRRLEVAESFEPDDDLGHVREGGIESIEQQGIIDVIIYCQAKVWRIVQSLHARLTFKLSALFPKSLYGCRRNIIATNVDGIGHIFTILAGSRLAPRTALCMLPSRSRQRRLRGMTSR